MKKNHFVLRMILLVCALHFVQFSHAQSYEAQISSYSKTPPEAVFTNPKNVALDPTGNRYVLDGDRVQKIDGLNIPITIFGSTGAGPGQLTNPTGIGVDNSGNNVYVVDNPNHRVQIFDNLGNYTGFIGFPGNGNGQFSYPYDVTFDSNGDIYVSDYVNTRIQKFDASGAYILEWHCGGGPAGLAVDAQDHIYVTGIGSDSISCFTSTGDLVRRFGGPGGGLGQFNNPKDIGYYQGKLYITDDNHRIQAFDTSGSFYTTWGSPGNASGEFNSPTGIWVRSGEVHVADNLNNRIQVFNTSGTVIDQYGTDGTQPGAFRSPGSAVTDVIGDIYVVDQMNSRIQKFSGSGTYQFNWGSAGSGTSQFAVPAGIAIDGGEDLYVADQSNNRIQKFSKTGSFIREWGTLGSLTGEFNGPIDVAVDPSDHIFVVDANNYRVQKFDKDGLFIDDFGSYGSGNGQFSGPAGITIDAGGNVYVSDYFLNTIQKFDNSGNYITQWGGAGTGNGLFNQPAGLGIDAAGNIYVADRGNNRVQYFSNTGTYLGKWGTTGYGNGEFDFPLDVTIDGAGKIFVVDALNNRLQRFSAAAIAGTTTTWNGTAWSNGSPTASSDVIIAGEYRTNVGAFNCNTLTVTATGSLFIYNMDAVNVTGALQNDGLIFYACNSVFNFASSSGSGVLTDYFPEITTLTVPDVIYNEVYSVQFMADNSTQPLWDLNSGSLPLPTGLSISSSGLLSGIVDETVPPGDYTVLLDLVESPCFSQHTVNGITITVRPPGDDPNLSIDDNIFMTYSVDNFKSPILNSPNDVSTYRVNSLSDAALTYSVLPSTGCVAIDANTGVISLSCAGPLDVYQIIVDQAANTTFDASSDTAALYLSKGTPFIYLNTTYPSFLVGVPDSIQYYTNSDGSVYFWESSDTTIAKVSSTGHVTALAEGIFQLTISISETDNFVSIAETFLIYVFTSPQAPIAVDDSLEVEIGDSFTLNILANDLTYMDSLETSLTDIDNENQGIQGKFLDPGAGSFVIDSLGMLEGKLFQGALGTIMVYYTITDRKGNQSVAPGRIIIKIVQHGEAPALKATELITPNDDGLNDAFVIGYVDLSKNNFLKIYDRNGSEIFATENYQNDWQGLSQKGKALESGIYYYLFNQNNGEKELEGMIEIRR